jgi:AraC-like DNA-binding protein
MADLLNDVDRVLHALQAGRLRLRIPRPAGLFRRKPRADFHPTPEFFIQTGGATDFECPADTFRLGTWEVCVIPGGVPHAETPIDRRTPYGIIVFMCARDGFLVHRAQASERREIRAHQAEQFSSARGRAAFRYLEEVTAPVLDKHRRTYQMRLVEIFLITMLSELRRPAAAATARSPLVTEAEKLARALLGDPGLSVARLAASLNCSADYLSRRFHQERGQTLTSWVTRERVTLARDLLAERRHTISEIGWMCGFSSASYFIRVFRQFTGVTPRRWRDSQNGLETWPSP